MSAPKPRLKSADIEAAVKAIIYTTRCDYEGHEPRCNVYDCIRHEHPEVWKVRQIIKRLLRPEPAPVRAESEETDGR